MRNFLRCVSFIFDDNHKYWYVTLYRAAKRQRVELFVFVHILVVINNVGHTDLRIRNYSYGYIHTDLFIRSYSCGLIH